MNDETRKNLIDILQAAELIGKVSEHHRIIGFRNILIYGYDIIDEIIRVRSKYGDQIFIVDKRCQFERIDPLNSPLSR